MKRIACKACGDVTTIDDESFQNMLGDNVSYGDIEPAYDDDSLDGYDLCTDIERCARRGGEGYGIEELIDEEDAPELGF